MIIVFALPVDDTSTLGVGARLGELLNVTLAEEEEGMMLDAEGEIIPPDPLEIVIAVDPPVEKVSAPDETVTFGADDLDVDGDMTPPDPLDTVTAVLPPVENVPAPSEIVTLGNADGVIAPPVPLDTVVAVDPPVTKVSAPDDTVIFGNDVKEEPAPDGVIAPSEPVKIVNAVDPPVEKISIPEKTVTLGAVLDGEITPPEPVELIANVLLAIVMFAFPAEKDSESTGAALGVMTLCEPANADCRGSHSRCQCGRPDRNRY